MPGMLRTRGEHTSVWNMAWHGNSPILDIPFTAKIVRTNDHGLAEAIEIAKTSPLMNTDSGWRLLPTIRKSTARK